MSRLLSALLVLGGALCGSLRAANEPPPHPLKWDAMEKRAEPKFEDGAARFEFQVTNTSRRPVIVRDVRPSCGCTTVDAPPLPWTLAPGAHGTVRASVDFLGKEGEIAKQIYVATVEGTQTLTMVVQVPPMDAAMRTRNQQLAAANRQEVFRGSCAVCHVVPGVGRYGIDLFETTCGVCHQSKHRASMVPDLAVAKEKRDAAWWQHWIEDGREGTLMPGFAAKNGGPLSSQQIDSLVEYLVENFATAPRKD